jgi:hypothetical protein
MRCIKTGFDFVLSGEHDARILCADLYVDDQSRYHIKGMTASVYESKHTQSAAIDRSQFSKVLGDFAQRACSNYYDSVNNVVIDFSAPMRAHLKKWEPTIYRDLAVGVMQ